MDALIREFPKCAYHQGYERIRAYFDFHPAAAILMSLVAATADS